jgi:hypothetical protein
MVGKKFAPVTKIMKAVSGKRSSVTGKGDGYHHGDLRAALLKSA